MFLWMEERASCSAKITMAFSQARFLLGEVILETLSSVLQYAKLNLNFGEVEAFASTLRD